MSEFSPELVEEARQVCLANGYDDCTGPAYHILLDDGSLGPHAWVAEGIHEWRRKSAAE